MAMDIWRWMHECRQGLESFAHKEDLQRHALYHLQEEIIHNHTSGLNRYPDLGQNRRNVINNNNHQVSTCNAEYLTSKEEQLPYKCPSGSKVFQTSVDLKTHKGAHRDVVQLIHDEHAFRTKVDDIRSSSVNNSQLSNLPAYESHYISTAMNGDLKPLVIAPPPEAQAECNLYYSLHNGKAFSNNSSLERPNELYKGENWHRCLQCGQMFLSHTDLVTHALTHTYQKPEYCPVCNEVFKDSVCLFQHMKIHHENKNGHVCSYCGKVFTEQSQLNKHFQIHMKPLSDTFCETKCKFTDASAKELRIVTRVRKKKNKCYICYKMFRTKSDLSRHMMIHTGERPFRCSFCPDGFIVLGSLKTHTIRCHQTEKALVDDQNGTGSQKASATDKRTALKETPNLITGNSTPLGLQCCKTKFSTLLEIQQHWLVHNEERPFTCPHCEMTFTKGYTRTKHIMRMHAGVKPNCLDCGREFTQFQDLIKHMKVHEEQIINDSVPLREAFNEPRVEVHNESVPHREAFNEPRVEVHNDRVLHRDAFNEPRVEIHNNVAEELRLNPLMSMEMDILDTRANSRPTSPREEDILDALM